MGPVVGPLLYCKWVCNEDGSGQVEHREAGSEREKMAIFAVMAMDDSFVLYFSKIATWFCKETGSQEIVLWRPPESTDHECVKMSLDECAARQLF